MLSCYLRTLRSEDAILLLAYIEEWRCYPVTCVHWGVKMLSCYLPTLRSEDAILLLAYTVWGVNKKPQVAFLARNHLPNISWEMFLHEPHCSIFVLRKQTYNTDNVINNIVSYLTQRLSLQCAAAPYHIESCCSTTAECATFTRLSDKVTILYVVVFPYICWRHCTHMWTKRVMDSMK